MKLKSILYKLLSISNDLNAIQRGPKAIAGMNIVARRTVMSNGKRT